MKVGPIEWVKSALQEDFARVHVFQQSEPGLARIRQYLIRGELPIVLIGTRTRIDSLSGIHGLGDFVSRLKTQSRKLVVIGLHDEEGAKPPPSSIDFDGVLPRPGRAQLRERDEGDGMGVHDRPQVVAHRVDRPMEGQLGGRARRVGMTAVGGDPRDVGGAELALVAAGGGDPDRPVGVANREVAAGGGRQAERVDPAQGLRQGLGRRRRGGAPARRHRLLVRPALRARVGRATSHPRSREPASRSWP